MHVHAHNSYHRTHNHKSNKIKLSGYSYVILNIKAHRSSSCLYFIPETCSVNWMSAWKFTSFSFLSKSNNFTLVWIKIHIDKNFTLHSYVHSYVYMYVCARITLFNWYTTLLGSNSLFLIFQNTAASVKDLAIPPCYAYVKV